jgi:hypothetical protein
MLFCVFSAPTGTSRHAGGLMSMLSSLMICSVPTVSHAGPPWKPAPYKICSCCIVPLADAYKLAAAVHAYWEKVRPAKADSWFATPSYNTRTKARATRLTPGVVVAIVLRSGTGGNKPLE